LSLQAFRAVFVRADFLHVQLCDQTQTKPGELISFLAVLYRRPASIRALTLCGYVGIATHAHWISYHVCHERSPSHISILDEYCILSSLLTSAFPFAPIPLSLQRPTSKHEFLVKSLCLREPTPQKIALLGILCLLHLLDAEVQIGDDLALLDAEARRR